jgi:hypothetical protein
MIESDAFRWCIYCKADCRPDFEYQTHTEDCPNSTNLWPITATDYECEMCCCMCSEQFEKDDFSMLVDVATGKLTSRAMTAAVVCIGCAAAISILGVKYE